MTMTLVSRFPRIILMSQVKISTAIRKALYNIQRRAMSKSRVATGNMRAGWQGQMVGANEGVVFNLVEYTIYNEYGTVYMSAQPMLRPAVEESRAEYERDLAAAYL
jgi:HK97 gp10 family phage protein